MIFEVGKEIIIPFLVVDAGNIPVTSGVSPTCTIKRSDGKYWNGATFTWVDTIYNNPMNHSFKGVYVFSFTPQIESFFIVRCSEPTYYKIEDGIAFRTVSRLTNLDLLDRSISSRLSTTDFDNKIDVIDTNVDNINSNVSGIKNIVDTNLDVTVSSRSIVTEESIWTYSNRTNTPSNADGVGVNTVTITVTKDNVIEFGVNVFVYDSNRIAKLSAVTNNNGQVIFKIDNGMWYFEFKKSGLWEKEVQQTILGNMNFTVDLESISSDDVINILFREFLIPTLEVGSTVKIGIEAYGSTPFSISSATATVTGYEGNINCTIDNKKIYALCPITVLGWNIIKFSVVVGNQIFGYEIRQYVD